MSIKLILMYKICIQNPQGDFNLKIHEIVDSPKVLFWFGLVDRKKSEMALKSSSENSNIWLTQPISSHAILLSACSADENQERSACIFRSWAIGRCWVLPKISRSSQFLTLNKQSVIKLSATRFYFWKVKIVNSKKMLKYSLHIRKFFNSISNKSVRFKLLV